MPVFDKIYRFFMVNSVFGACACVYRETFILELRKSKQNYNMFLHFIDLSNELTERLSIG